MDTQDFERIVNEQLNRCRDILTVKATEYATDDRLHNFKVAAGLQGVKPKTALAGMMAKHTVSVYDMCLSNNRFPIELWDEKITDSINYLLLLRALIEEKKMVKKVLEDSDISTNDRTNALEKARARLYGDYGFRDDTINEPILTNLPDGETLTPYSVEFRKSKENGKNEN